MNDLVQGALVKVQQRLQAQEQARREELALYFDLYTREYAPDGKLSAQYHFYDSKDEVPRYFRKVAIRLTDEEAAQLTAMRARLQASVPKAQTEPGNAKAGEVSVLGIALVVAGILIMAYAVFLAVGTLFQNGAPFQYDMANQAGVFLITGAIISIVYLGVGRSLMLLQKWVSRAPSQDR